MYLTIVTKTISKIKCSICNKEGHNKRSCKTNIVISSQIKPKTDEKLVVMKDIERNFKVINFFSLATTSAQSNRASM